MNVLQQFIQSEMDKRGWRQTDLVRASGLAKQLISTLVNGPDPRRMIAPDTVAGLARAFQVDQSVIVSVAAEAVGVPIHQLAPIIMTAEQEPDEVLLEILLTRRRADVSRRRADGTGLETHTPSDPVAAPNHLVADNDDGGGETFSGEKRLTGDPRGPGLRSHGSDADDPEAASPGNPFSRLAG